MKKKIINSVQFFKTHWPGLLQFFLLAFVMTMGFDLIYAVIWASIGLPQEDWAFLIIGGLAVATEYAYLEWVKRT